MNFDVNLFTQLARDTATAVGADGCIIVPDETHAVNRLRDSLGIQVVWALPSVNYEGNKDSLRTRDTTLVFVLTADNPGQLEDEMLKQFQDTSTIAKRIIAYLSDDYDPKYHCLLQNIDFSEVILDPVYREFGGWNGYTFAFTF